MSTKRLDFTVRDDGKVDVIPRQGNIKITCGEEPGTIRIVTKSWKIEVSGHSITIKATSKAADKKRVHNIPIKDGSLFLYNSTNNWYWYFREKEIQDRLDALQIDKIISVKDKKLTLCYSYESVDGKKVHSKNSSNPTLLYYGNISEIKNVSRDFDVESGIGQCTIEGKLDDYLLVEFLKGHRTLYINSDVKVSDLYDKGCFDDIKMTSILNHPDVAR